MSFSNIVFLIAKDPAAIELGYVSSSHSTPVIETDEFVEIMVEDVATLPLGEITIPPHDEVRT